MKTERDQSKRIAELDSLRGIMALIVASFHFTAPEHFFNGSLAVDFFFILSGLVLTISWAEGFRPGGGTAYDFTVKRLARLYPLHLFATLIVVVLYLAFVVLYNYPKAASFQEALSWHFPPAYYRDGVAFSLLQNILLVNCVGFNPSGVFWNGPSWSISVEFWINLIAFQWLRERSSTMLVCVALLCYVFLYNYFHRLDEHYEVMFGLLNSGMARGLGGFIFGMIAYRLANTPFVMASHRIGRISHELGQPVALATILWVMHNSAGTTNDFVALVASFILVWSIHVARHTWIAAALRLAPLVYLGEISYSLYLNHFAIQYLLQDLVQFKGHTPVDLALFMSILIVYSTCTYQMIEKPGRRLVQKLLACRVPDVTPREAIQPPQRVA